MKTDWYDWRKAVVNLLRDTHNRWELTEQEKFDWRAWVAWMSGETPEEFSQKLVDA